MNNNISSHIKTAFVLLVDLIGLVIIFFILIFVLNYFKIAPLSKTFPTFLGWLPEKQTLVTKTTPVPSSSNTWHQAEPALISNYTDYFKTHSATISSEIQDTGSIDESVLIGYSNNFMQVETPQGHIMFKIDGNTHFYKIRPSVAKNGVVTGPDRLVTAYNSSKEFFQDTPFGSFLTVTYKVLEDTNWQALTVNYFPEHKF